MFEIMSIKEFAKEVGKSESTIRTWRRRGNLPSHIFLKIGGEIFIKTKKFQELIEKDLSEGLDEV